MNEWHDFTDIITKDPPKRGVITTYNLDTAFTNWNKNIMPSPDMDTPLPPLHKMNPSQAFIYTMNNVSDGLYVIVTPPKNKIDRILKEALHINKHLNKIRFIINKHNHTKMVALFWPNKVRIWNGSKNLNDGNEYYDIMTEVKVENELKECKHIIGHLLRESITIKKSSSLQTIVNYLDNKCNPFSASNSLISSQKA